MKLPSPTSGALQTLRRRAPRELRRWGWPGALGAGLLLAAVFMAAWLVPAARAELGEIDAAADAARQRALNLARSQRSVVTVVDPAAQFRAAFPPVQQRHQRLAQVMSIAASLGLEARRGEFRELQESQLGLVRYRLTLPLVGHYAAARKLVEQALREDAALSLDNLRIERSDVQSDTTRIELQFSLWMRPDDAGNDTPPGAPLSLSVATGPRP
ncbi:MAG: hypothetical protein Q8R33_25595 [Burkholderiales bacterium]|nr:hypothetical protein [Burkholderiales bacterium]